MANKKDFKLEIASIEDATNYVRDLLKKYKCADRDRAQAELFTEEAVVYWAKAAAAGDTFQIALRKRFKTITISLSYRGAPADPLSPPEEDEDDEFSFIGQNILIGLSTVSYSYENGYNTVNFTLKEKGMNPLAAIVLALGAAVICGLSVNYFAPALQKVLSASILTPLSDAFFGLLSGIVIPFLFMSVIASIFNMENIAQMKRVFRILFSWFAGMTAVSGVITALAGMICFPLQDGSAAAGASEGMWTQIAAMLFDIVPSNMFKSFLDSNTLQTIFLAAIMGIAMLAMKERFPILTKVITELNLIFSTLLDAVCSLMPWVIFICIFNMLLTGDGVALLSSFGVVALICACFAVLAFLGLASVAVIEKKNPVSYIKTIGAILLIAISTASSSATFAPHTMIATTKQGIRDYLVKFTIPAAALFLKPFMVPVLFLTTLFVGSLYGINFGTADIVSMILLCIIIAVAAPPSLGMGAFLFTVVFKKFGIPLEGLALAASLYIFFDYPMTTGDMFFMNISMLHTEHWLRLKDRKETAGVPTSL
ncbi:MAG: cation:dicarboxylase symporter family transporter [Firmicutes bacterium]|nr:cation:dicarboxylase symporter family transporter [Bacillota bacterium]